MKALVLAAVVLSGCTAAAPDPAADPAPDAAADPDAAPDPVPFHDPAQPGPWAVGVRTVEVVDASRARTLPVDVWYPVDPAAPDGEPNTYELVSILGPLASIDSPARRDATPAPGARPLVLFSHGYGGIRFQSYFLTEHLASHGFVVVSADHPGNTLVDFAQLGDDAATAQSAIDRPLDLLFVLDRAIDGGLGVAVTVDPDQVAATGHSFGAWTALEVARRDARIGAVFPLAPGFRAGSTPDFVATLARPILLVGGSADETCEFVENQQVPYDLAGPPKYLLEVLGAGHLDFSNLCEVPLAAQFIDDGCDPASIDPAVVQDRVIAVATAFAYRHVVGDVRYDPGLAIPHVVAMGDVAYWAEP
jgi:predicted dienelactone hydrolase